MTHTSFVEAKRTLTGSRPTGTLPIGAGTPVNTSKNSTRLSGRLQTASVRPSGPRAMGWTGAVSKFTKFVAARTVMTLITNTNVVSLRLMLLMAGRYPIPGSEYGSSDRPRYRANYPIDY